ncbi:MAG: gamma carbonic anhydrase family protein [Bacteroidota bacterium]
MEEIDGYYKHSTALVYGKVSIGKDSSLWPYSVIRSEMFYVEIGEGTNIQDHAMIHIGDDTPTIIGDHTSITHRAVVHGAKIGNNCIIGVGAVILDGAVIGDNCIIGAGAVVEAKANIKSNSIVVGSPAKVIAEIDYSEKNKYNAEVYAANAKAYAEGNFRVWEEIIPH